MPKFFEWCSEVGIFYDGITIEEISGTGNGKSRYDNTRMTLLLDDFDEFFLSFINFCIRDKNIRFRNIHKFEFIIA